MPSKPEPVRIEPFFGGFILETLTIGMYGESRNAIREYIQNGFDSILKAIDQRMLPPQRGKIQIILDPGCRTLVIRDNGTGISVSKATEILTRVGASTKDHRRNAGFRGIGRLAGIVFSDTVTFITKAKGESKSTTVAIDAKRMRKDMAPKSGGTRSATELLTETVRAFTTSSTNRNEHFFEVKLEGLRDAPEECRSVAAMVDFVSQIAPVPYDKTFPFQERLEAEAKSTGIPIEQVHIDVRDRGDKPISVTKPYGEGHRVGKTTALLEECDIYRSPAGIWWAWVGKKSVSGAYTDRRVAGLRVRVRNIQIDGTNLVREIFGRQAVSHARFQSYFVGEVFVSPGVLVPNARRDGFEENPNWRKFTKELGKVTQKLSNEAYEISKKGVFAVGALKEKVKEHKSRFKTLRRSDFADVDRAITFSKAITTTQRRVADALQGSTVDAAGQLSVLVSELADMKRDTLAGIGATAFDQDRERIEDNARQELLKEILNLLEDALSPTCFTDARGIILDEYGDLP